jgi:tetratricopeptide (TPR) repeat protein
VTQGGRRSALAALDPGRPAIARLDSGRDGEDLAADLIEAWSAVETALRSLVGGSMLSGQPLIREARQRQLLGFEQANALAEFYAVRERVERSEYRPSAADVTAARDGFLKFESGLANEDVRPAVTAASAATLSTEGMRQSPLGSPEVVPPPRRGIPGWVTALSGVIVLVIVAAIAYVIIRARAPDALARGIDAYSRGQREAAVGEFNKAVRDNPNDALPHVYLSRMAREVGNLSLAGQEAQLALKADPNDEKALREMGSYLLTAGNYELARRFYIRALGIDPADRPAQGFLGCALLKLGRVDEGIRWVTRAGQGAWSNCIPAATPAGGPPVPAPPRP